MGAPSVETLNARFDVRVDRTDGCWEWTGATNGKYGQFRVGPKVVYAHRYAYLRWTGPIEDGLTIDHLCRNRLCVNPAHLEAVSNQVNIQRARRTHCLHGHAYTAENTYLTRSGTRKCRTCHRAIQRRYYWSLKTETAA